MTLDSPFAALAGLLLKRREVIADHAWRDRDATGHLNALMEVSLKITAWSEAHKSEIDARLRHYLGNSSFDKALAHIEAE